MRKSPEELVPGRRVHLLWASPSCTHHSRAKGGRPRSNQLRAQPDLILPWIRELFVERLIVENVPEFVQWGPLDSRGKPIERLKGSCFRAWVESIKACNYIVDWRIVNCADYGDATSRRRFFLKAVRKGCGKINWPEPTHAENPQPDLFGRELKKWRGIRECLDLTDLGRSIFDPDRSLSKNTLRRVAVGMERYNGMDFLMDMLGVGDGDIKRVHSLAEPLPTQHTSNRCAIVRPFIVKLNNNADAEDIDAPLSTITTSGGHHALANPIIIDHFNNGEAQSVDVPIGSQTTHDRYSIVTPLILGQHGGATCDNVQVATPVIFDEAVGLPRLPDGRYIDILLRMLKPSELAAAHSFPKDYVLTGNRGEQVKQIGNSVPVMTAAAMCEADFQIAS